MKSKLAVLIIYFTFLTSYSSEKNQFYPNQIGDLYYDKNIDDPNFKLCNEERIAQYYNFGRGMMYKGEKVAIRNHFKNNFFNVNEISDSGYITIRFIVNCNGHAGRYRVYEMGFDYQEKQFNKLFKEEILTITKKLNMWDIGIHEAKRYDYYQYLTFKILNGKIIDILP